MLIMAMRMVCEATLFDVVNALAEAGLLTMRAENFFD